MLKPTIKVAVRCKTWLAEFPRSATGVVIGLRWQHLEVTEDELRQLEKDPRLEVRRLTLRTL